ncbi:AAA family ATPase [Streptomyces sp. NPDC059639]|uniref:AAA family ATPase n=1 Tax=Streptomyces sp. NPDC059639 TaxID=3346891 RepID=UPI0036865C5D
MTLLPVLAPELADVDPTALVVAVGPGGSGKSTYSAAASARGLVVICLDALRQEVSATGDAGDQSATPAAVALQGALLDAHLRAGEGVFLDSTNVEIRVRADAIARARVHGRPVVALRFLPDLDVCRARNAARPANRRVPDNVLDWQHALAAQATVPALLAEGFTAAHDVTT